MTGEEVDARKAMEIGLVEEVVPADQILDAAVALAAAIRENAPLGVRLAKAFVNRDQGPPGQAGIDRGDCAPLHDAGPQGAGRRLPEPSTQRRRELTEAFSTKRLVGYNLPRSRRLWMPPFWKGDAETAAPDDRARALLARLQTHASHVYGSSEFYRRRFDDAGVDPGGLIDFEALASLPVVTKQEIIDDQKLAPPYGTMLGTHPDEIIRQYIGPGPQTSYFTRGDLAVSIDDAAWCFSTNGFRSSDVVDVTIMYHWVIAGTIIDDGYRSIGYAVIPGGIGMGQQHVDAWRWSNVTGVFALPTFLDELGTHVEEAGCRPHDRPEAAGLHDIGRAAKRRSQSPDGGLLGRHEGTGDIRRQRGAVCCGRS